MWEIPSMLNYQSLREEHRAEKLFEGIMAKNVLNLTNDILLLILRGSVNPKWNKFK